MRLERIPGELCPRCECNDTQPLREVKRWGKACSEWRCNHCLHKWLAPAEANGNGEISEPDIVVWPSIRCPHCDSKRTHVTSSPRGAVRYHKCDECRRNFKSKEPD